MKKTLKPILAFQPLLPAFANRKQLNALGHGHAGCTDMTWSDDMSHAKLLQWVKPGDPANVFPRRLTSIMDDATKCAYTPAISRFEAGRNQFGFFYQERRTGAGMKMVIAQ